MRWFKPATHRRNTDASPPADDFSRTTERNRLADALLVAMAELDSEAGADRLLQSFADLLVQASPHFRLAWFYIGDPEAEIIRPDYCAGPEKAYGERLEVSRSRVMMRGPVRQALGSGEPSIWNIPERLTPLQRLMPGVPEWHAEAHQRGVRAALALPFTLPNRSDWGLTLIYAEREGYFDQVGLEPFKALGRLVQVGLDRIGLREAEQRSRQDVERVRHQDPLTGLANRPGFEAALRTASGNGHDHWVLLQLDLDDFAALNAGGGETFGNAVLRAIAQRLRAFVGEHGLCARVGADEFLLALPAAPEQLDTLARDCMEAIAEPLDVEGTRLALSASLGATRWQSTGDTGLAEVQRELAVALARARADGPGAYSLYELRLDTQKSIPQGLLAELRVAMEEDQLELWYQPQMQLDTADPTLYGAEALIRWRKPDGELVPPGRFIPAAESSAEIRQIGNWVINDTLRTLAAWGENAPGHIGINIGARHLLHERFLEELRAALARYPTVNPARLCVEITETAALSNVEAASRVLEQLRELGPSVALDDFGTGHGSLVHLHSMPLDIIKIDRAFVDGLDRHSARYAITEGLLVTARGLGLGVVAEGVERAEEALVLHELGCRVAQGYYYARPLPRAEFEQWVRQHPQARPAQALPGEALRRRA